MYQIVKDLESELQGHLEVKIISKENILCKCPKAQILLGWAKNKKEANVKTRHNDNRKKVITSIEALLFSEESSKHYYI